MQLNKKPETLRTHEGAKASHISAKEQLRRTVMSCMLWEKNFYEEGKSVADRIAALIPKVHARDCVQAAIDAREKMGLRHVPLLIVREMARLATHRQYVGRTLQRIIKRPDEITEFMAIYWKDGKCPISAKVKQGLAFAFQKFNEYQLAKYNRDGAIKLRDVMFMVHAKPKDADQGILFKKLANNELKTPDTWEVALSGGADKHETFSRLMRENKLGALAFIRNLRNMIEAKISKESLAIYGSAIDVSKIFPYQFIAAAKTNPQLEPLIEEMMFRCLVGKPKIKGKTIVLVDVSGSMDSRMSQKSEMLRLDAAYGLAILLRELCEDFMCLSFSNILAAIPLRRGFALRDAIHNSQSHSGTDLRAAIHGVNDSFNYDRLIVITDEQTSSDVMAPKSKGYILNVGTYENGIGYGQWTHINGFSQGVLDWLQEYENEYLKVEIPGDGDEPLTLEQAKELIKNLRKKNENPS